MAVSDRTRKILWTKAGGRCSMCRELLVVDGTGPEGPSVFGEEAHIVAQSATGPRAAPIADVDGYDNLILLCSKHHKQIDDQVSSFTIDQLNDIKVAHERWVQGQGAEGNGPVRLIPDPTRRVAKVLKLFTTGSALWHFVDNSMMFYPSWPGGLPDEHEDMIAEFLDDLRDWGDAVGGHASYRAKRDAAKAIGEHIQRLAGAGYFVCARERFCLLIGGVQEEPSVWRVIDLEIQPADIARVVQAESDAF